MCIVQSQRQYSRTSCQKQLHRRHYKTTPVPINCSRFPINSDVIIITLLTPLIKRINMKFSFKKELRPTNNIIYSVQRKKPYLRNSNQARTACNSSATSSKKLPTTYTQEDRQCDRSMLEYQYESSTGSRKSTQYRISLDFRMIIHNCLGNCHSSRFSCISACG